MTRPLVSIILPTHNRADVLRFAVASCLAQTVGDFELLLVGDGCTDGTAALVPALGDARIRWFDLPKAPGFGYAHRNFALREARGAFIAWQAHDDLWMPDHLELLVRLLESGPAEWVHSRPLWVTPGGRLCPASFLLDDPATLDLFLGRADSLLHANCIAHRAGCVGKYGLWNEALPSCGDWDYWARIIEGGARRNLAVLRDATALHFRAAWRTDANAASPRLQSWIDWHAQAGGASAPLRVGVGPERPEQECVWREIERDPAGWPARVRAAVRRADVSRLAWDEARRLEASEREREAARQLHEAAEQGRALSAKLGACEASLAGARREAGSWAEEVRAMKRTSSWRMTAPLRALRRVLAGR